MIAECDLYMKKLFAAVVCACALACLCTAVCAHGDTVRVYADGEYIAAPGRLAADNTVLPMRAFFEKLGYAVEWNGADNSVCARRDGSEVAFVIGETDITVNGARKLLPCASFEEDGVTYLPVRAVAESIGYTVDWIESANAAVLYSGAATDYLPDTPTLLPELGAAVGTAHFSSVGIDEIGGETYYLYEGVDESKAHEYGDLLCAKLGYEYDSMLLNDDYSKTYYYTFDDFKIGIRVATVNSVPCVYLYPGTVQTDGAADRERDAESDEMPPDDGEIYGDDVECYEGTSVPTYEFVCGYPLERTDTLRDGETVYVYRGSMMDAMTYMGFLSSVGYSNYNIDVGGFNVTHTMVKDGKYVIIMISMLNDEVYVVAE